MAKTIVRVSYRMFSFSASFKFNHNNLNLVDHPTAIKFLKRPKTPASTTTLRDTDSDKQFSGRGTRLRNAMLHDKNVNDAKRNAGKVNYETHKSPYSCQLIYIASDDTNNSKK